MVSETCFPSPSDVAATKKRVQNWAVSFAARSCNYSCKFIDTHCHIDYLYSRLEVPWETTFSKFREQHSAMFPCNYEGCVAVFCNPNTFNADNPKDHILKTIAMEDGIWLAFGCHPKHAAEFTDAHLGGLRQILKHPKVVALGEIGLDYSGPFSQHSDIQKLVFRQQIQLALELQLPLVIHCRDADDDCLEILTQMVPCNHKIHAHCFTRGIDVAERWLGHFPNLFLGLTPVITYKSAVGAISTAESISLDRLLLETDAPFFVPSVLYKDVRYSYPGFALFTAEKVAQLRHISVDEVLTACRENTKKMYGI
ncbi:unnamed protein product [Candidula unifasciata]|uniref:Uncharacterized protein n=1 Tax=Candidula unifasciata TaxID=100452 RepID=A0A8S3ZYM0_9EUPU|nr:unnamed protein product [Candidula unifasciata]